MTGHKIIKDKSEKGLSKEINCGKIVRQNVLYRKYQIIFCPTNISINSHLVENGGHGEHRGQVPHFSRLKVPIYSSYRCPFLPTCDPPPTLKCFLHLGIPFTGLYKFKGISSSGLLVWTNIFEKIKILTSRKELLGVFVHLELLCRIR